MVVKLTDSDEISFADVIWVEECHGLQETSCFILEVGEHEKLQSDCIKVAAAFH